MQGTLLDGRFRVDELIRSGVLFDVYGGKDLKTKSSIVVKVLRGDWKDERDLRARLEGYLGKLKDVSYMGLTEVLSADAVLGGGPVPYVVRSRALGESALQLLGQMGTRADALNRAALKLAAAVKKVHSFGLVHGGLHADNVYLESDGATVVTDLGTSDLALLPPAFLRDSRCLFLPPEVRRSPRPAVPADDVYAWGAVMYALLMGEPPPRGSDRELMRAMQDRYQGFGLDVIRRAFHEDPAMRYADADRLHDAVKGEFRVVPVRVEERASAAPAAPPPASPPRSSAAAPPAAAPSARPPAEGAPPPRVPVAPPPGAAAAAPAPSEVAKGVPPPGSRPPAPAAAKAEPAKPDAGKLRGEVIRRAALLPGQSYYEMLDVPMDASQEEIKKSFHSLARRFHPDRLTTIFGEADRKLAQTMFESYSEAYGILSDEVRRRGYDLDLHRKEMAAKDPDKAIVVEGNRDRKQVADEYLRDAQALASRADFWGAAQTVRQALLMDPVRPGFHLELGRYLSRLPKWRRDAEKALIRTLELAPGQAEAHYLLGTLYQQAGMETRAAEQFRKAVAIDPDDERYRQAARGAP